MIVAHKGQIAVINMFKFRIRFFLISIFVSGVIFGVDNSHPWLQEVSQTKRWQNAIKNPAKIVDNSIEEVVRKDLGGIVKTTGIATAIGSAAGFAGFKAWDLLTRSSWQRSSDSDIAKVALAIGGIFGIMAGYEHFERKKADYQYNLSSVTRIDQMEKNLEKQNKMKVFSIGWDCSRVGSFYYCRNESDNLKQICENNGLIWATLNQIRAKTAKTTELQAQAVKNFYLANALLELKSDHIVKFTLRGNGIETKLEPESETLSFPDSLRRAAIKKSDANWLGRDDARYRKSLTDINFGQVKKSWAINQGVK